MTGLTDEERPWLDRVYARAYQRLRGRYVETWLAASSAGILLVAWPTQFFTLLPLWGPGDGDRQAFVVTMVIGVVIVIALMTWIARVPFRPVIRFLRGEPVDPADVWFAAVRRMPVVAVVCTGAFCLGGNIPAVILVGAARGFAPVGYLGGWLVACLITAAAGFFFVLIWEVAFRPLLREVQPLLPADFDAGSSWLTLSRRSALASASAMAYTGAAVSSLVAASRDRDVVLLIAVGATLGSAVTFGGIITGLVSHSIFMRVSELKAALVRIGDRDYRVRVSVRAGDELDEAAVSLNRMAERLARDDDALRASRARLASIADAERQRMERDLRLRVLARLEQISNNVSEVAGDLAASPDLHRLCARVLMTVVDTEMEINRLARGVYPAELTDAGLDAALAAAAERMPMPVQVQSPGVGRLDPACESSVYFTCNEALQNAAKHAGPDATVTLALTPNGERLGFAVHDDGPGFAIASEGHGLENMRDRVRAVGGDLTVVSTPGGGTRVEGWVPGRTWR